MLGTSSSEAALPSLIEKMERAGCARSVVGLVVPDRLFVQPRRHQHLHDAGRAVHRPGDRRRSSRSGDQVALLLVAMLSSKGAAGVTGAGFITLAATLSIVPAVPVAGMALILGIDRFMSECRSLTNFIGNAVATIVVARWEGALDRDALAAALDGEAHRAPTEPADRNRTGSARSGTAGLRGGTTMRIRTILLATAMGAGAWPRPLTGSRRSADGRSAAARPIAPTPEPRPGRGGREPTTSSSSAPRSGAAASPRRCRSPCSTATQIDATGAVTGDDLLRAIPQMGEVSFNPSNNPQTSNAARGDVNSINLRNLGTGNTLVLLNGRRLVSHPTSQAGEGNIPVLGPNANALAGRRDRAARNPARRRVGHLWRGCRRRRGEHGPAHRFRRPLARRPLWLAPKAPIARNGRSPASPARISAAAAAMSPSISIIPDRTAQLAEDQIYTATNDLRFLFANDPDFAGNLAADDRATQSPWAQSRRGRRARHDPQEPRQPGADLVGRRLPHPVDRQSRAAWSRSMPRPASAAAPAPPRRPCATSGSTMRSTRPSARRSSRFNAFLNAHYDISDTITAYAEIGYYRASSHAHPAAGHQPQRDRDPGLQLLESRSARSPSPTARPIPTGSRT